MEDADRLKQDGTEQFKAGVWVEALGSYRAALGHLPLRREARMHKPWEEARAPSPSRDEPPDSVTSSTAKGKGKASEDEHEQEEQAEEPLTGLQLECAKARAILNANIGACHVKLVGYILKLLPRAN